MILSQSCLNIPQQSPGNTIKERGDEEEDEEEEEEVERRRGGRSTAIRSRREREVEHRGWGADRQAGMLAVAMVLIIQFARGGKRLLCRCSLSSPSSAL